MSKLVRFGARSSQIPNFLGNIHAAQPHVVRNVGTQRQCYCREGASRRRLFGNYPTVHLRRKSVTEMADLRSELSGNSHCTTRPRIHVEKGAIRGPKFPYSQLSAKYPCGGPPCCQTRWCPGECFFPEGASRHRLIINLPTVHQRLKAVTEMVAFGPELFADFRCASRTGILVKRARSGSELSKFPTFLDLSM